MLHIKSFAKKNKNEYSYNIFLEKDLYKDKSNTILNEYLWIINATFW